MICNECGRDKTINEFSREINENAKAKGFWNVPAESRIPQALALIHSEVSEALEESRELSFIPIIIRMVNGKPEGFAIELADIMIRVMDLAFALGIDLENAIAIKHEYNLSRPVLHGKRF